ncbi:GGDEF domain-containing protein [Myxococcota bacterium]|nr:GGDEF domain-containing protein [Myxococcota bacterium]
MEKNSSIPHLPSIRYTSSTSNPTPLADPPLCAFPSTDPHLPLTLARQWNSCLQQSCAGLWYWSPPNTESAVSHAQFPVGVALQDFLVRLHPQDASQLKEELQIYYQKDDIIDPFSCTVRARQYEKSNEEAPEWHWLLCRGNLQKVPWSTTKEIWGFFVDITSFKEEEERLAYLASHDPLTGLNNRALFTDRLQQTLERMNRRPDLPVALLFLDCDHFKSVNDQHGHTAGDQLLQQIAKRITRTLRLVDTIARFGGDEFVVLLDNTATLEHARLVAERLRQEMHAPFVLDRVTLHVSVSVGLLWHEKPGLSAKQLIDDADRAMYQAKQAGGDRVAMIRSCA